MLEVMFPSLSYMMKRVEEVGAKQDEYEAE